MKSAFISSRTALFLYLASSALFLPSSSEATTSVTAAMTVQEPNPPNWPESVIILRDTEDPQTLKEKIEVTQDSWIEEESTFSCEHHFSDRRYAVLFAPGVYRDLELEVGYYSQVAGLGVSPDDVQFHGKGPYGPALNRHIHGGENRTGTCLDTFWRSAENFANHAPEGMIWAVSQASPLRRVHVKHDLYLHDKDAYASGGHIANAVIDGHTHFGGQQQYLSRNVKFGNSSSGGAWGMVYVGCENTPAASMGKEPDSAAVTVVEHTPVRVEKPYVAMCEDKTKFQLRVPQATYGTSDGPQVNGEDEESRDFTRVKVARSTESTACIQEALDEGKDVVLAPGIFYLDRTIEVSKDNQVLLGLGLATLVAPVGLPCIRVRPGTQGVRIAGLMLEAPAMHPDKRAETKEHWSLLEFGAEGIEDSGNRENPGALFDIFCRVGGGPVTNRDWISISSMIRIHSSHVVGDNLWLWRADHAELKVGEEPNCKEISPVFYQTEKSEYNVDNGIVVIGNNVTIYGLAVEHTSAHQTIWRGENGTVFFYQCEFPYDVTEDFGDAGYRGYLIDESVKFHALYSPGIYSNFRNAVVQVETAIEHPESSGIHIINPFTVHLDNNGLISTIVNGNGPPASKQGIPSRIDKA